MAIEIYEVRRRLMDASNNLLLPRGAYVETEETAWVARFGKDLKRADTLPNGVRPTKISGTTEGMLERAKLGLKPAEKEQEPEPVATPAVTRAVKGRSSKVVLADEISDK